MNKRTNEQTNKRINLSKMESTLKSEKVFNRCQECVSLIQSILTKRVKKVNKVYESNDSVENKEIKVSDIYQKYSSKIKNAIAEKRDKGQICHEAEEKEREYVSDGDVDDDEDYVLSEEETDDECECECDKECYCYAGESQSVEKEHEKYFGCEGCNYEWRSGFKAGWVKAMNYIYKKTNKAIPKTYVCSNCNVMSETTKKCGGTCEGATRYCSKECQIEHWNEKHKKTCNSVE